MTRLPAGFRLCSLLALGAPLAGCTADRDAGADAAGADADPATRVVSLMPSTTEIVIALGGARLLVARTEDDGDDPALSRLPSVGHLLSPNLEAVRAVEPDLVIAWSGADLSSLRRVVEGGGGRVRTLGIDRLSDVGPAIDSVGAWIGRAHAADSVRHELEDVLERARAVARGGASPRILWVVGSEPLVAAGSPTFIDDVMDAAGGQNVAAGLANPWPRLGLESLVSLDPDVVVWPDGGGVPPPDGLATRPGWGLLRAVREGRVIRVPAERFDVPGPAVADATLELARRLREMADGTRGRASRD